jgi:nicotinamidase-related amidase
MTKRALIVVDVQNDYFPGGKWTLSGMNAAADNAARVLAAARAAGDLVVHVRHESLEANAPFFVPGTPGAQIHASVQPRDGETMVLKHQINSFRDTKLKEILDGKGITSVVVCGAMSHFCIDAAVRAADDFGYAVTLIHDACATRDLDFNGTTVPAAQVHAAFMAALGQGYATSLTTAEFLKQQAKAA